MKFLYEKYLVRTIAMTLIFSVIILAGIVWLSQVLRLTFLIQKQVQIGEFIFLTILIIPSLIHTILPFAILYATLYSCNSLKLSKELIVLQVAGISPQNLSKPVLKISILLFIISIINASYFMPLSYSKLKDRLFYYRNSYINGVLEEGVFNNISKNIVIFLSKKNSSNHLEGVILFDKRNKNLNTVLIAKEAQFVSKNGVLGIDMKYGSRQSFNQKGDFELMNFDKFMLSFFKEKLSKRSFDDRDLMELYLKELIFAQNYTTKPVLKYHREANNRITWCFMNIILPILGMSIFLKADFNRRDYTKVLIKSFFGAMVVVSVHFAFLAYPLLQYLNIMIFSLVIYLMTFKKESYTNSHF